MTPSAGLATQLLCEVFSSSFLSPLEDSDTCFKLEVEHLNLRRYLEMLKSSEFRDDLDVVSAVPSPKGKPLQVPSPKDAAMWQKSHRELSAREDCGLSAKDIFSRVELRFRRHRRRGAASGHLAVQPDELQPALGPQVQSRVSAARSWSYFT